MSWGDLDKLTDVAVLTVAMSIVLSARIIAELLPRS
jgi:hypothetical protein